LHDKPLGSRKVLIRPERFDNPRDLSFHEPRLIRETNREAPRPMNKINGGGGGGGDLVCRVYVGNLDFKVTDEQLRAHVEPCGEVKSCFIIGDHTGRSRG
jgi:RNA recognition motif-containing protein